MLFVKPSQYSQETPELKSLFDKVAGREACNFDKKRLQHGCFSVNAAKFLRTSILKNINVRLFWRTSTYSIDFRKWLFRTFLWTVVLKTCQLKILQKYGSLSNQSFKYNLAYMVSLNLTPPFEPRIHTLIIRDNTHMTSMKINFQDLHPLSVDFGSLILNTPTPSSRLPSPTNYGTTTAAWM